MATVVITAGSRGIGLEQVKHYLKLGHHVITGCRAPENCPALATLAQHHPDQLRIIPLNVNQHQSRLNFAESLADCTIDLLIHTAGLYGPNPAGLGQFSDEEWLAVLQTNTIAPLRITELLLPQLSKAPQAKIAILTSKMGSIDDNSSGASYPYRSSKAAINAVGKSLAIDLKARNIAVALLHPGWVKTDMGGKNALINTETSVSGMAEVIDKLSIETSGLFYDYQGNIIPW